MGMRLCEERVFYIAALRGVRGFFAVQIRAGADPGRLDVGRTSLMYKKRECENVCLLCLDQGDAALDRKRSGFTLSTSHSSASM